jgi:hypothetical protein
MLFMQIHANCVACLVPASLLFHWHNMHQVKLMGLRTQCSALQRSATALNTPGATVGCSMWTRALEGLCMNAGQEYEAVLSEKLRCAGIAFFSENTLREEGFFKTPDVKLEV